MIAVAGWPEYVEGVRKHWDMWGDSRRASIKKHMTVMSDGLIDQCEDIVDYRHVDLSSKIHHVEYDE